MRCTAFPTDHVQCNIHSEDRKLTNDADLETWARLAAQREARKRSAAQLGFSYTANRAVQSPQATASPPYMYFWGFLIALIIGSVYLHMRV